MARLITPVQPRVYDPNARGAVTSFVKMRADNPFIGGRAIVTKPALSLRGRLAGLGEGEASPATTASTGLNWEQIAQTGTKIATGIAQQLISAPTQPQPQRIVIQQPGMTTGTKIAIAGGVAGVLLLVGFLVMRKG